MTLARHGGSRFWPETDLGKWTVGLFVLNVVAFVTFTVIAVNGAGTWDDGIFDDLVLGIPLLVTVVSAISTLVVGIVAMARRSERATSVVLAVTLAGMATLFFLGELLSVIGVLPAH